MAKLHFKYGAMNAGKSTILLQTAHNYEERGQKVILIKPMIDTKGNDKVVSRLGIERTVDILLGENESLLYEFYFDMIKEVDCLIVDEAQFLTAKQVEELWMITKELDIPVICYGLKTDFKTNSFAGSKRLLELADELIENPTICDCGKKARFNARSVDGKYVVEGNSVEIDNNSKIEYRSMCGNCYIKKVLKRSILNDTNS